MAGKPNHEELETKIAYLEKRIEELERSEAEKSKMEIRLRRSEKIEAIVTLAGGIAHDFNNILFPIIGYTEMTLPDVMDNVEARSNLEEVLKSANRAKALAKQILAFSRQSLQEVSPVNLQSVVIEAARDFEPSLPPGARMTLDIDEACGPILADPAQIRQVMMNLCNNAAQAMKGPGGELSLRLSAVDVTDGDEAFLSSSLKPGSHQALSIRDNGCGMDRSVMERIFDPYFTTKPLGEGTGLGLSAALGIIKSYGGDIQVESSPGEGAVFVVYLPAPEASLSASVSVSTAGAPGGKERILLVDDEAPVANMAQLMLERLGYLVTVKNDGAEALETFREAPDDFDIVITDRTMPRLGGEALAAELLRIRPDLPVILCIGFSEKLAEERARNLGIRTCVMKPMVKSEIAGAVRRTLENAPDKV
ncbi:MAG: response regulator [Desulfobacterales bacterium]|nr:response regulator [Desulfobacterales bacterium]